MNIKTAIFSISLTLLTSPLFATGISVDAGLNPSEDRWIIRLQLRQMDMDADMSSMRSQMLMAMAAYGYTRDVTLMVRQTAMHRKMMMDGTEQISGGLADLAVLAKFGLLRKNTRDYILAVATTVAIEMPTGEESVSSRTWDLQGGLYGSWRSGRWGNDLNLAYTWNGFTGPNPSGLDPGNEIGVDAAFSYQFSLGKSGNISLTPVLELTYRYTTEDYVKDQKRGGGGSIFFISPGLKFTFAAFIIESLLQIPVSQTYQNANQNHRGLIGLRYMF